MRCPKCGKEGGVLLLFDVAPCDSCAGLMPAAAKGVGRRWVPVDWVEGAPLPEGTLGWNSWNVSATKGRMYRDEYAAGPVPMGIVVPSKHTRDNVMIVGSYDELLHPTLWSLSLYRNERWRVCLVEGP